MSARSVLAAAALAGVVLGACSSTTTGAYNPGTGLGPLPTFELATLEDPDVTVSSDSWQGTPTIVNFWATWCEFCVEEMPALQAASEALAGDVRFVGIDRQDPRDDALAFLAETGVTYDQLASPAGEPYTQLGSRGMPTTLFVDADGVVVYRHTGPLTTELVLELAATHLGVEG